MTMLRTFKRIGSALGIGARAFVALVGVAGITVAVANYAVTQGSGTNFGSIVVGAVHYAQQLLCDPATPAQCAAVDSSGRVAVAAPSGSVASGAVASGAVASG